MDFLVVLVIIIMVIVFALPIISLLGYYKYQRNTDLNARELEQNSKKENAAIPFDYNLMGNQDLKESEDPKMNTMNYNYPSVTKSGAQEINDLNEEPKVESAPGSVINLTLINYRQNDKFPAKFSSTFPYVLIPPLGTIMKQPQSGRLGRKGFKEDEFKSYLYSIFCDYCTIEDNNYLSVGTEGIIYEPDFTLKTIKEEKNILIDIEIDEPYEGTNDLLNRKPTHCVESDSIRNYHFQNRGWIVIRFAEIQIHQNPLGCCYFIAKIISSIDYEYSIPDSLIKQNFLEPIPQWSESEAKRWSLEKYRESYLGIDKFILSENYQTERKSFNSQEDLQFEIEIQNLVSHPRSPIKFINQNEINELLNTVFLVPYRKGKLWTLYNLIDGRCKNDIFNYAFYADNSLFKSQMIVLFKNKSYCLLDAQSGQPSIKCYDYLRSIETDREIIYIVSQNHKYGIINNNCKSILNFEYEGIYCVWMTPEFGTNERDYGNYETTKESFLKIRKDGKLGLFDTNSLSFTFPCQYDEILENSNEEYRLIKDDQMLLFDLITKKIIFFEKNLKDKANENLPEPDYLLRENYVPSKRTLWDVKNDILLYNGEIVYKNPFSDLYIDGFFNGIGRLIESDYDDEGFGGETSLGYIDIYGNLYFED